MTTKWNPDVTTGSSRPAAEDRPIRLDGASLTTAQITGAAYRQRPVELSVSGRDRAADSQQFAESTARSRPLYGRSTGVGANRTVRIAGDAAAHVLALLRSHATSAGEARSVERVRAMLVVRLNQLAAGGSGVAPAVLDGLLGMITADALPDVRELGSIGTGDLSALATTALALMGEGPTTASLPSLTSFGPSDGLAFISSNAGTLGDAALAVSSLQESARAALAIAALTFHAVDGNAEAYSAGVLLATPFPGAAVVCEVLREFVGADPQGLRLDEHGRQLVPSRIQDPFGLRALPQVHGPVLDQLADAMAVIDKLVNAPTENPLVLSAVGHQGGGFVAHHAGFHFAYLQMALDSLGLAVAQSAPLVMARLATLLEPTFTALPPFLGDGTAGASGVMVCEYVAASALGAIRANAVPAGLQTVTLSRGVEEDASFASLSAAQNLQVARRYRQLVACELVVAVRANRMQQRAPAGRIGDVLTVCSVLPGEIGDRNLTVDLAAAVDLVPALAALVDQVIGHHVPAVPLSDHVVHRS
jgi:histidine ammonia-lyase